MIWTTLASHSSPGPNLHLRFPITICATIWTTSITSPCIWSNSLPSFSYNHKCNDLDQPVNESSRRLPAMWSKSFPSFSYNNRCNDLDHTSVTSRASGPNHCLHFPITISVTKWTSCRIITFSPGPNRNLHFPITICATIWTTDAWTLRSKSSSSSPYNDSCHELDHYQVWHIRLSSLTCTAIRVSHAVQLVQSLSRGFRT